jgi:hypothetical protein
LEDYFTELLLLQDARRIFWLLSLVVWLTRLRSGGGQRASAVYRAGGARFREPAAFSTLQVESVGEVGLVFIELLN